MKTSIDFNKIISAIASAFRRFHTTAFIVIIVLGLSYAVLSLNSLIGVASDTTGDSTGDNSQISPDEATVNRIKELYTSSDAPSSIKLPSGRINPFAE